jgi:hypothetical protein
MVVDALRKTPFWERDFAVVEILPAVENAYAANDGREAPGNVA